MVQGRHISCFSSSGADLSQIGQDVLEGPASHTSVPLMATGILIDSRNNKSLSKSGGQVSCDSRKRGPSKGLKCNVIATIQNAMTSSVRGIYFCVAKV